MVAWLSPKFLLGAGLELIVSALFAKFADKREVEAGLPAAAVMGAGLRPAQPEDEKSYTGDGVRDADGALWFDFASDVGEGFHPTYTVAYLLAKPKLPLVESNGTTHDTKRGSLLVLGGDQVYPSASWPAYRDRFVGPYRAALPFADDPPDMYAIPGNHDWYDGLTSFVRLFCQGNWIGGWRTRQRRSYFALQLSPKWWLWGIDIQFDTYMDGPQLEYFRAKAKDLKEGHRVILATAKPSWVGADAKKGDRLMGQSSWETLTFVEEEVIAEAGARVAVTITGDKHHYSRYASKSAWPRERLTAGGGGAHTSATHDLPEGLTLYPHRAADPVEYGSTEPSPTRPESEQMRDGLVGRVMRERGLGYAIGGIYAIIALLIAEGIKHLTWAGSLLGAPTLVGAGLVGALAFGLIAFAKQWKLGLVHWAFHVVPLIVLIVLVVVLLDAWTGLADDGLAVGLIAAASAFALGSLLGPYAFARYLLYANDEDPSKHTTEIYGGLASTEHKNFLRFRLGSDGGLTIYPIGIRRSPEWSLDPEGEDTEPWFAPDSKPEPRLIEDPIEIPPA